MSKTDRLLVLYGSQTFTAQEIAERVWRTTKALGFSGPVLAMDEYPITKLIHEEYAIFVCSTTGQGEEPDNMKNFWKFLLRKNLPSSSLAKLKFGVLGLGDSSYSKFNFAGKRLHKRLVQLGARPLVDVGLCDYQHDLGHDAVLIPWTKDYFTKLKLFFPHIQTNDIKTKFIPRWKVILLKNDEEISKENGDVLNEDIYFGRGKKDCFNDALCFEVEKNIRITDDSHFQDVRLLTLKSEHPLNYRPGDVFNIRPRNSKDDVNDLFGIFEEHSIDIKPNYKLLVEECLTGMV